MKIYNKPPVPPHQSDKKIEGERQEKLDSSLGTVKETRKDKFQISNKAQKLQKIQDELARLDGERSRKIEALKKSVESGQYKVSGKKIAGKMINDLFLPPTPRI